MKRISIVFLLLTICLSAFARLNETYDECVKRYGKPVNSLADSGLTYYYFFKGGYVITVVFNEKKRAIRISYRRPDPSSLFYKESLDSKRYSDITLYSRYMGMRLNEIIINHLLAINSEGKKWTVMEAGEIWVRTDGVEAVYDTQGRVLAINSAQYLDSIKNKALKDLVGF